MASPRANRRGTGCVLALLAAAAGIAVGVVLTFLLWNLTGSDDAEEASISAGLFIGMITIPVCVWLAVTVTGLWYSLGDEHRKPDTPSTRADALGLALGAGLVCGVAGLLVAMAVWRTRFGGGDAGSGAALLLLGGTCAFAGAAIGVTASLAWHRRRTDG